MSSSTDRLRELLDERGVEWTEVDNHTLWWGESVHHQASAYSSILFGESERVHLSAMVTPEQAIAATLGSGTCHMKEVNLPTFGGHDDGYFIVCSECAFAIYERRSWSPIKYCPNCGRKVIG